MQGFVRHGPDLRSARLPTGVPHAFTTRRRAVARPADLLPALVRADLEPPTRVWLTRQVHGNALTGPGQRFAAADAHLSDDPDLAVAVKTADCVPLLLATADGRAVAAVHAGWRGLAPETHVIRHAVDALCRLASVPSDRLLAVVGPCVSAERYEVGPEVAARFRSAYPAAVRDDLGPKPHLEIRAVALIQLLTLGLPRAAVQVMPTCTFDHPADWYSFRRDGPGVGHQYAMIAPRR
ncbi:MAG: polyphenol oxidase family protein [Planctomycetota bacterium]